MEFHNINVKMELTFWTQKEWEIAGSLLGYECSTGVLSPRESSLVFVGAIGQEGLVYHYV